MSGPSTFWGHIKPCGPMHVWPHLIITVPAVGLAPYGARLTARTVIGTGYRHIDLIMSLAISDFTFFSLLRCCFQNDQQEHYFQSALLSNILFCNLFIKPPTLFEMGHLLFTHDNIPVPPEPSYYTTFCYPDTQLWSIVDIAPGQPLPNHGIVLAECSVFFMM